MLIDEEQLSDIDQSYTSGSPAFLQLHNYWVFLGVDGVVADL